MSVGTIEKRRRRTAAAPPAPALASRGLLWAMVQLAVLAAEVFAILFVLAQPAFRPTELVVGGIRHVSRAELQSALGLPDDRTIFFLNHKELEQRLSTLPWIESASVSLALPNRVAVRVTEWKPSAVLQVGESTYYLNDLGRVLDPASEPGTLAIISRPGLAEVHRGDGAVSPALLTMLLQLRTGFHPAFGVSITSFTIDDRNVLSAQTDRGWRLIFGQMLTADDRATLEPKVAALHALSSRLDLTSKQILYINLENPGAPAVQMRGRK